MTNQLTELDPLVRMRIGIRNRGLELRDLVRIIEDQRLFVSVSSTSS